MAREYFENLVTRSFFQKFRDDIFTIQYKMHDIVHDFAQSITKAHHLGFSTTSQFPPSIDSAKSQLPPSTDNAKNLRTIIFFRESDYNMSNLFQNFKRLHVLTLYCRMKLPDTVENLIHLRYLELSLFNGVLPETICNLCNLQFLKTKEIPYSSTTILPQGIGKLINLRHLIGYNLVIPGGIGRLTSLRTLNCVLINDVDIKRCRFEELKNLNHLRDLSLSFMDKGDFGDVLIEGNVLVLNALEPLQDLEKLRISWYQGTTMSPNWLTSLTKLKELYLDNATKLMSLPPLGMIPCLESLTIVDAWSLKKVGVEFLGIESKNKKKAIIFPNLKYLEFFNLTNWEEWIGITGKEDADCIRVSLVQLFEKVHNEKVEFCKSA